MNIRDIFLILASVGVDLQISSTTIKEEIKLYKKIIKLIKRKCTKLQKKQYKRSFDTLNQIVIEIEDFQKQKREHVDKYINSLESELIDLKTMDELEENFRNYKKWKENISLEKKKKVLELQEKVKKEIFENSKIKRLGEIT